MQSTKVLWGRTCGKEFSRRLKPQNRIGLAAKAKHLLSRRLLWNTAALSQMPREQPEGKWKNNFITEMNFIFPEEYPEIPVYRVMDNEGNILDSSQYPMLGTDLVLKMYQKMTQLNIMDKVLLDAHSQGSISFYLTNEGEEGLQIASAGALNNEDLVYLQYREAGVLLWRGFSLYDMASQCIGNVDDEQKGRMMPVHYGSKKHNIMTISSPLATQIPQAAGSAYAFKRAKNGLCVVCYFGEGTASEGDAHAAFNFAATLECPVIFFCKNNGHAISTKTSEQFRGDGISSRASGYGMATLRVDGNDIFAVYNATKAARKIATSQNRPVLLEAMTYRLGNHSTSDDCERYRPRGEADFYRSCNNPIVRLRKHLYILGVWNEHMDKEWLDHVKNEAIAEFRRAEEKKKPSPDEMFTHVYDSMPKHIREQHKGMIRHVKKYSNHYPTDKFEKF